MKENVSLSNKKAVSNLITWINFIMTVAIVFLHSDCSYMLETSSGSRAVFTILNTAYDMAVPCFFTISAYLFYINITDIRKQYKEKIKRRIFSLVIPYFLFSALWMFFYSLISFLPVVGSLVPDSVFDHSISESLYSFLLSDYDPPIWYVRTLFILQLISPIIYIIIKNKFWIAPIISICFVALNAAIIPGYSTPLFWLPLFVTGIWYSLYFDKINSYISKVNGLSAAAIWLVLFICAVISSKKLGQSNAVYYLYRIFASVFCLIGLSHIKKFKENKNNFSQYSFFVFMVHYPIVQMFKRLLAKFITVNGYTVFIVYIITAVVGCFICFLLAYFIKKYLSKIWKVINGGR